MPDGADARPDSTVGTRYDRECYELARDLWAFVHSRNAASVSRDLQTEYPGIEARTISRWARLDDWAAWVEQRFRDIAPGIQRAVVIELINGSLDAARYLRRAVRGDDPASGPRVIAATNILDRAGFAPQPAPLANPITATINPDTSNPATYLDDIDATIQEIEQRQRLRAIAKGPTP